MIYVLTGFLSLPWRPLVAKLEDSVRLEREEKEAQRALKLRQADFESLEAKIESDFQALQALTVSAGDQATEHALDMKYLRERQQFHGCA